MASVSEGGRYNHLTAGLVELHRVRQQIQHDLTQRTFIRYDVGQAVGKGLADNDAFSRGLRLHKRHAFGDNHVRVDAAEIQVKLARLDL